MDELAGNLVTFGMAMGLFGLIMAICSRVDAKADRARLERRKEEARAQRALQDGIAAMRRRKLDASRAALVSDHVGERWEKRG